MSTANASDGPTRCHGWSGLSLLYPADCGVVWVAAAAGVPDVDVALLTFPLLLEDAALHKFNEMSTIGPWMDAQGMLKWDYVPGAGFKNARKVWNGEKTKDALIERKGHMVNDQDVLCITGYRELGKKGNTERGKKCKAIALGEHHSHIYISAICQRGASVTCEKSFPRVQHHCYDPEQSALTGQKARQVKGLKLHVCKKCQRTTQERKGTSCLASACRSNSLKLCQHLD